MGDFPLVQSQVASGHVRRKRHSNRNADLLIPMLTVLPLKCLQIPYHVVHTVIAVTNAPHRHN